VIIDEAHNVLDTIAHIHSAEISRIQVQACQVQLKTYLSKYKSHLKAKNLLYIKQILFILNKLNKNMTTTNELMSSKLMLLSDFLYETEIFNLNLFKLIKYIEKSKISYKLQSFSKATKVRLFLILPHIFSNFLLFLHYFCHQFNGNNFFA
jgi:chromosome transmission fidelity protein 1